MSKTEVKWTLFDVAALLMNVTVPYAFLKGPRKPWGSVPFLVRCHDGGYRGGRCGDVLLGRKG